MSDTSEDLLTKHHGKDAAVAGDGKALHPDAAELEAFLRRLISRAQSLPTGSVAQAAMLCAAHDCCFWWLSGGGPQFDDPAPIKQSLKELYEIIGRRPHVRALRQAADSLERHLDRIVDGDNDPINSASAAE